MFVGTLPEFSFINGDGEDILVAWQMTFAGDAEYFTAAEYKLVLAAADARSGLEFLSAPGSDNLIMVDVAADEHVEGQIDVTFTLRAPWRALFGRAGSYAGNLQIMNSTGIADLATVKATVVKRPTYSEN